MSVEKIFSVTQITRDLKRVIEGAFGMLWVEGELSGYKRHTSGHHYFTLKDSGSQIACAMWRMNASRLAFEPRDGVKVQAWGNLEVYEPAGRYQLIVALLRPAGEGERQRKLEELKRKLAAEGLFDSARKRDLPLFPTVVGLVTSGSGAALHDMVTVAARRWPAAQLLLCPVAVQGSGAAQEIAMAIERLNHDGRADVLVVGRGGGSLEDLWAFNEEIVARAIFDSTIPVVSAVGHEVDITVADLVADVRAATPSAAMEIVLPDRVEMQQTVRQLQLRLGGRLTDRLRLARSLVASLKSHWAFREPANTLRGAMQRLDDLHSRLQEITGGTIERGASELERLTTLLSAYSPQATLERGYAVVHGADGRIIRDASNLMIGEEIMTRFARGGAVSQVSEVKQGSTDD